MEGRGTWLDKITKKVLRKQMLEPSVEFRSCVFQQRSLENPLVSSLEQTTI